MEGHACEHASDVRGKQGVELTSGARPRYLAMSTTALTRASVVSSIQKSLQRSEPSAGVGKSGRKAGGCPPLCDVLVSEAEAAAAGSKCVGQLASRSSSPRSGAEGVELTAVFARIWRRSRLSCDW